MFHGAPLFDGTVSTAKTYHRLFVALIAALALTMTATYSAYADLFTKKLDGIWALICSINGAYLLNLQSGERRAPKAPNDPSHTLWVCHFASTRKSDVSEDIGASS